MAGGQEKDLSGEWGGGRVLKVGIWASIPEMEYATEIRGDYLCYTECSLCPQPRWEGRSNSRDVAQSLGIKKFLNPNNKALLRTIY